MKDLITMQREGRKAGQILAKDEMYSPNRDLVAMTPHDLDQHTVNTWKACKDAILESGLLENKPMTVFSFVLKGEELEQYMRHKGHNQAVEAVKEFMSNMDTNSVDSIHSNKQAN